MAVNVNPISTRLSIRYNMGLDENFDPIYGWRSYSNIKTDADNDDVHQVASLMGGLCDHTLSAVRRQDTNDLEEA